MPKNPYYKPEHFGLELTSVDQHNMSYEYNTLCFWATKDGRVFTAQDSGCSCPTPFENYEGKTQKDVLQKLEQVGSVDQAERTFDAWNDGIYSKQNRCSQSEREEIIAWVKSHLTSEETSI